MIASLGFTAVPDVPTCIATNRDGRHGRLQPNERSEHLPTMELTTPPKIDVDDPKGHSALTRLKMTTTEF